MSPVPIFFSDEHSLLQRVFRIIYSLRSAEYSREQAVQSFLERGVTCWCQGDGGEAPGSTSECSSQLRFQWPELPDWALFSGSNRRRGMQSSSIRWSPQHCWLHDSLHRSQSLIYKMCGMWIARSFLCVVSNLKMHVLVSIKNFRNPFFYRNIDSNVKEFSEFPQFRSHTKRLGGRMRAQLGHSMICDISPSWLMSHDMYLKIIFWARIHVRLPNCTEPLPSS